MAAAAESVLLLAGRLKSTDEAQPVRALIERLGSLGFAVQVVCTSAWPGWGQDNRVFERTGLGRRWQRFVAVRWLRPNDGGLRRPSFIHVLTARMSEVGLALADRWQVPYVQTIDDFLGPGDRLRISRRWCRGFVASGRDLAESLIRDWGVPERLVTVVHSGITVAEGENLRASVPNRVPVIGTSGPLVDASGFATFLNAARRVLDGGVDAEFVVAGQGADEVDLRRRAERLRISDRVTFAGQPAVGPQFWNVLDVYCQPATGPSTGRTLAAAMASGVPAIASDVEGLRSLVTHEETGLRVPPENSGALAEAILSLLADPERAHRLGLHGRARIRQEFDPASEASLLAAVYRGIDASREPSRDAAIAQIRRAKVASNS
jgi:glycosyltransferase involved in cell wall biosynthesis